MHLPTSLLTILRSDQFKKVGSHLSGDLARLFKDCVYVNVRDLPFKGAINLGQHAKARHAVMKASVGLADLVSTVLRKYLEKDPAVRISQVWDKTPLPDAHVQYAALDAYAAWKVFDTLQSVFVGKPVDEKTPGGTPVSILSADHSLVVAHGHIALDRPQQYDRINVTKTRVLVVVTKILVPAHIVSHELLA